MPAGWDRAEQAAFAAGLWRRDPALWSAEPAHQAVAARRLGWLGLPAAMRGEIAALETFAGEVRAAGFTHAVLLGMGGSSLAPEVMRRMLGVCPGFLELTVLDNTSPAAVRAVAGAHDPARTLCVVSSKSGGTIEVAAFERHFFEWSRAARGDAAGAAFVAVTDPGSPLDRLATERGYRRVFRNPPDVGGRYSALSLFGLVPAALIGADLESLLGGAAHELDESRRDPAGGPGVALGAAVLLFATKTLEWQDARTISWDIFLVIGAGLALGEGLQESGAAQWMADQITSVTGDFHVLVIMLIVAAVSVVLSNFMSNTATAAILAPVLIGMSSSLGIDPKFLVLACAFSVSLSFMTPIGTPPFTLIFSTGMVSRRDIALGGIRVTLPAMLIVVGMVYLMIEFGIV